MRIAINKDSATPLREQIASQLSVLIHAGAIRAGQPLPSIRALAARLRAPNSAVASAYDLLKEWRLVVSKPGSGVRVVDVEPVDTEDWRGAVTLRHLTAEYVEEVLERGFGREEVLEAVRRALEPRTVRRLVVVDRDEDFFQVYRHELGRHTSLPVERATPEQLQAAPEALADALVLASMYHVQGAQEALGPGHGVVVLPFNSADALLAQLQETYAPHLRDGVVVGVALGLVSRSQSLMEQSQDVLSAVWDYDDIACVHADDEGALRWHAKTCDAWITDEPSHEQVAALLARHPRPVRLFRFNVLPRGVEQLLGQHLPPAALRIRPAPALTASS